MREAQAAGWPVVVVNDPLPLLSDDHLRPGGSGSPPITRLPGSSLHTGPAWRWTDRLVDQADRPAARQDTDAAGRARRV